MRDHPPIQVQAVVVWRRPVNHRGDWVFVGLTDAAGRVGYGEASHGGDDDAVVGLLEGPIGDQVTSTTWAAPASAWSRLVAAAPAGTLRKIASTAASAIEQALWDLAAQARGERLVTLLGASADVGRVPLYANINRATTERTPAGFARNAVHAVADGFRAVKMAPFDEVVPTLSSAERRRAAEAGLARVAAVREALGPEPRVLVDAHSRYGVEDALEVARELANLGVGWFEDPVPYEDGPAATLAVRRGAPLPIATGERLIGAAAFEPFLAAGAAEFLLPDVKHIGGIGELLALAAASRGRGVSITPHNPSGPISTLASASALASVPHAAPLEFAWGEVSWRPTVLEPPERIANGALILPSEHTGLGAALATWVREGQRPAYPLRG
ncbi:MAG: mandelate racemase/muconate lactonizing enzyme family protein [Chloroflexi bacterium]|nr:mandelate racemase/muconate lactonizing enzyme family protein [Chloroflexota bacterium]